jgi:hypothetical protein
MTADSCRPHAPLLIVAELSLWGTPWTVPAPMLPWPGSVVRGKWVHMEIHSMLLYEETV